MKWPQNPKKTLLLVSITIVMSFLLISVISMWLTEVTCLDIPNRGMLKTIGMEAYWDEHLENKIQVLNWDTVWYNSSENKTIYLRSLSTVSAILKLNTTNWNPDNISKYMNLSWNYDQNPINPGDVIQVKITLSVPPSEEFKEFIITNNLKEFSFDIVISAIE